jgi:acyl-homoserine-lactone acylase
VGQLNGIACPSATSCLAVGHNGAGTLGEVLRTTDGGRTWTTQPLPSSTGPLTGVACPSASDCIAVGQGNGGGSAVVATDDGGSTWEAESFAPGASGQLSGYLTGISCPSRAECFATHSGGYVFVTRDGGASWGTAFVLTDFLPSLEGVTCTSALDCLVVGTGATVVGSAHNFQIDTFSQVLTTENGGNSWREQDLGAGASLAGVGCSSGADCYAVGSGPGAGAILRSTDGGNSWSTSSAVPSNVQDLFGVSCASKNVCYAVGATGSNSGEVIATTDGGATWTALTIPSDTRLLSGVTCATPGTCLAVGASTNGDGLILSHLDSTPPTTSLLVPSGGSSLSSSVDLDAAASDPLGVTKVEFTLSGGPGDVSNQVISTASPTVYGWIGAWDTRAVPNGTYTLESVATDTAGNAGASPPVTLSVVNRPVPTLATEVLVPKAGATLTDGSILDASAEGLYQGGGVFFEVSGNGLIDHRVATATLTLFGWIARFDATGVPPGTYTLQSVARDATGKATSRGIKLSVARASSVSITRDGAGIPHITASNFRALGYGEAWADSQDNFCTLAQNFVTVNGDRSEYFGPNAHVADYLGGVYSTNLDSDFYWKSVDDSNLFNKGLEQLRRPPPLGLLPQVLSLYEGFVSGYNAYLASGRLDDPTCKGKPWVRPIDLKDLVLSGYQLATVTSSEQFINYEVGAKPPAHSTSATTPARTPPEHTSSDSTPALGAAVRAAFDASASSSNGTGGSNGIAIGSQDTAAGDGMVLANPHVPWEGPDRFWMAQLTVPGQYDVEGGALIDLPLVLIGFNRDLAWTHTQSTDWRFTLYQLKLVPGDPTSYLVDGHAHKMAKQTVVVYTRDHRAVRHTFYMTRWGPVINISLPGSSVGLNWTTTTAYAMDDSIKIDNDNDLPRIANELFRMGQATTVQELLSVQSRYLALPFFDTLASDDTGHVYYGDVGNTPNVPLSLIQSCTPSGLAHLVYSLTGIVTLDGSLSACAWKTDPGTPVPGIFDAAHLPHTIRSDYVENSNDSYWLANPSSPFPAYSPIVGNIDIIQNLRTRLGNQMIAKRIAGTDGFGPPKFTLGSLQAMWESDQSLLAQLVLPSLVSTCRATPSAKASDGTVVNLAAACTALAGYDGTGHLDAKGGWLFSEWATYANASGGTNTSLWADAFDPAHPLTTPSKLNTANPQVLSALADAVENLEQHHVPLDASYREVQHVTRNGTTIPVPGCSSGCFNAIDATDGQQAIYSGFSYGQVVYGSSLVMTTELTPDGPVSQGILTYSEATNPKSPWYSNMTGLYAEERWVPLPYTPAELAQDHPAQTLTLKTS